MALLTDKPLGNQLPNLVWVMLCTLFCCCVMGSQAQPNAPAVEVFKVEAFATPPAEQLAAAHYLYDYRITDTLRVSAAQAKKIAKMLQSKRLLEANNLKACPFVAAHILRIQQGSTTQVMIIATENCPKCKRYTPPKPTAEDYDLRKSAGLYAVLKACEKP